MPRLFLSQKMPATSSCPLSQSCLGAGSQSTSGLPQDMGVPSPSHASVSPSEQYSLDRQGTDPFCPRSCCQRREEAIMLDRGVCLGAQRSAVCRAAWEPCRDGAPQNPRWVSGISGCHRRWVGHHGGLQCRLQLSTHAPQVWEFHGPSEGGTGHQDPSSWWLL